MAMLNPLPSYCVRIHRLDPTVADVRIEFTNLPSDVEVTGRLVGPRCPGMTTIEVAYPLRRVAANVYGVVIPDPVLWSAQRPCVYEGPIDFMRDGQNVGRVTVSCGIARREADGATA